MNKTILLVLAVIALAMTKDTPKENLLALELGLPGNTDLQLLQDFLQNREQINAWLLTVNDNHPTHPSQSTHPEPRLPSPTCTACRAGVALALSIFRQGVPIDTIGETLVNLCVVLKIVSGDVCRGAIDRYLPPLKFMIEERPWLQPGDFCSILIQNGNCGKPNATFTDWDISLDGEKPELISRPLLPRNRPTVPILQLTDVHLDLNYVEGSNAACQDPLCCRDPLPPGANASDASGHFGAYPCDFPLTAMENLFQDAASRYDEYAFVLLTGDYVHHAVWATEVEENKLHNAAVASSLAKFFPDTTIYPVLGNHEPHPCNMYPPRSVWGVGKGEFDLSWLFLQFAELYSSYLPPEALESFLHYGYYTVSPSPGFRLIVTNTNLCYNFNFWIFYEYVDPAGQLQWLADKLLEAEKAGEIVYLVGHVPPGHHDCWGPWTEKFNRIVNRFENIILAQFYGHTHEDDLKIFFEGEDKGGETEGPRPTNSLYIGASVTTYTDLNPGYKVYHVDGAPSTEGKTWEILDHETFIYNLTEANADFEESKKEPQWFQLYSALEAYGLNSLRPNDLYDFVVRMVNDDNLFQLWLKHYNKAGINYSCSNSDCRLENLCDIVTTNVDDSSHCERLKSLLEV